MSILLQQFMQSLIPIYPEAVVITVALMVLIMDFFVDKDSKALLGWFSLAGIAVAAFATFRILGTGVSGSFFSGTFNLDPFSIFFKFVFFIACGLGILVSINYLKSQDIHRGEYYSLMLFATSGMMLMASAGDVLWSHPAHAFPLFVKEIDQQKVRL